MTARTGAAGGGPQPLPLPASYRSLGQRDVHAAITIVGLLLVVIWLRHGGHDDALAAAGQLTALGGTYAALIGLLFSSRLPALDQVFGSDELRRLHRITGFLSVAGIVVHALVSTLAFAGGQLGAFVPELASLTRGTPGILGAIVGTALLVVVAVSSIAAARRRLAYETWHGIHLYAYLAMAFGFLHQLVLGTDLVDDPFARGLWVALYLVAFAPLLACRFVAPALLTLRHRPVVAALERAADGAVSLTVAGRSLERLPVRSGQFFVIRPRTKGGWWRGHPFSISAAPNGRTLRFTFKLIGEGTRALAALPVGTPLILEGPYGGIHGARRRQRRLLFLAGGIGAAPLRALAESLPYAPGDAIFCYRGRTLRELAFRDELEALARLRGLDLRLIVGRRGAPGVGSEPLGAGALRALAPDLRERDVYLCGSADFIDSVGGSLREAGVPEPQIHVERFW